ncbi:YebC/PmpR family DNA-binding transcriptional regulator [Haloferula rosea]|uniref:Probable transcriptional regulatory protein JIN81_09030 n=1 Tax=Haloferula rosea TaxID=490093 RepID=A0A934VB96_9BACT|nr:YebC/PmpR family DNA-binding transcriptional regulator [Haloferula rosea]MBK1827163.1 YebC/PmpR family DNA-binding transcriptional regulator [Haloferula rosea]
MGRAFECRRRAKEARWDKMSRVFPKLAKSITLAAKNGGGDPDMNPALRLAISNAKAENLPKDKIDAAIKRATGGDAADISEVNYEGKGPHGSLFYIECATDNTNRSVSNLKTIFSKNGGQLVQSGQLDFMFTRKAVVEFEAEGVELEEVELELIDHGLEELEVEDGLVRAIGDYAEFANLSGGVEKLGITIKKAALERIPTQPVEMSDEQMNDIEALLEKIEEDEDVQLVFTNLA